MRPILVDFKEDGSVEIDKAVFALHEIAELARIFGKQHVEVLVRLWAYRTPINPFAPEDERLIRAVADTERRFKTAKVKPATFKSGIWDNAVKRFILERYDPLWESFVANEKKCQEFAIAIGETPVQDITYAGTGKKRRKGAAIDDDDDEGGAKTVERRVDNTEQLSKMNKALTDFMRSYEETRAKLFRVRKGAQGQSQNAQDFRDRHSKYTA